MASANMSDPPAVRFSSKNEEIPPETSIAAAGSLTGNGDDDDETELNPNNEEDIRQLKSTLQSGLQSKRMEHYNFEPVSLPSSQPVSRVCKMMMLDIMNHTLTLRCVGSFRYTHAKADASRLSSTLSETFTTTI